MHAALRRDLCASLDASTDLTLIGPLSQRAAVNALPVNVGRPSAGAEPLG